MRHKKAFIKKYMADQRKAARARAGMQMKFFLSVMMLFAIVATVFALISPEDAAAAVSVLGGTSFASMMAIGNIDDVGDREVSGNAIGYRIWLAELSQIDTASFPKPNANREISNIPLKSGEVMHYIEAHAIPTYSSTGERGDLTINSNKTFQFIIGGIRDVVLNFLEEKCGCKFIIIFQECESGNKYILGNPCKPMVFSNFELKDDNESRSVSCSFTDNSILQFFKYVGTMPNETEGNHTADQTTLTITAGVNSYKIPDGTSATYAIATVSGLSASDKGRVITLIGEGGANAATVESNTTFILEDQATWTAKAGSRISLRVLDDSTLVEIAGTRIQTT